MHKIWLSSRPLETVSCKLGFISLCPSIDEMLISPQTFENFYRVRSDKFLTKLSYKYLLDYASPD